MSRAPHPEDQRQRHWDAAYTARGTTGVSWYQPEPRLSLELIDALRVPRDTAVIDVGGGASFLADRLHERGFDDLTVLDVSESALDELRGRFGDAPIHLLCEDVLEWQPARRYGLWHDRAVFHFLVEQADRRRYLRTLHAALDPGGLVLLATFAPDGPNECSGLPVERYSADQLSAILGERFETLDTRREVHVTPRGAEQPFTWVAGRLRT